MHHLQAQYSGMPLKIIRNFNRIIVVITAIVAACMVLLISADVIMDYCFNNPINNGVEIVSFYFMVAIVFLPMGSVELHFEHIATDLLVQGLPRRTRNILYCLTSFISVIFVLLLTYQTGIDAIKATKINEMMMGTTLIEIWPSKWLLPIGFGFLSICISRNMVSAFLNLDEFTPVKEEETT